MKWVELLKQPCPYTSAVKSKLGVAAFFGFFIWGFLIIFKPFELHTFSVKQQWIITCLYGLITFSGVFISVVLLPLVYSSYFREESWTTGKQISFTVFIIVFVGILNYLLSPMLVQTRLNLEDALWFQGITLAVAILPVSLFIMIRQNQMLQQYKAEADRIEKRLHQKQESERQYEKIKGEQSSETLILAGEYQDDKIEVLKNDLYVIVAASNYVKVYYQRQDKLVYAIIRLTMKKAEEILAPYNNFLRCHRAYIINLDKVVHVEGNAQGFKIQVEKMDGLLPVSRNLNVEFSDKLLAVRNKNTLINQEEGIQ
jgi:hypothetical protein